MCFTVIQLPLLSPAKFNRSTGKSQILAEQPLLYARMKCEQLFLKLGQSLDDAPHVLKKDEEYRFSFSFVIPNKLPAQACQHSKQNIHVFEAHTELPPTLGWIDSEHDNARATDDLASDVAQISYTIRVLLFSPPSTKGSQEPLCTATKPVRVIPKVEEQPPREGFGSQFYCTHKEKVFKQGLFGRSLGRLRVSVPQPSPIKAMQLDLAQEQERNVSTTASIQLSFDAVGTQEPPALSSITARLCAVTMYSATPWETLPDLLIGDSSFAHGGRGVYWNSITNSSMSIKSVGWTHNSTSADDSTALGSSDLSPFLNAQYTASIVVPVTVPARYQLVPTFHSCLVSRVYLLDIGLHYYRPGVKNFTSEVCHRVPVQVVT